LGVTLILAPFLVILVYYDPDLSTAEMLTAALAGLGLCLSVVLRRHYPVLFALAVALLAAIHIAVVPLPFTLLVAVPASVHAVARYTRGRSWWVIVMWAVGGVLAIIRWYLAYTATDALLTVSVLGAVSFVGLVAAAYSIGRRGFDLAEARQAALAGLSLADPAVYTPGSATEVDLAELMAGRVADRMPRGKAARAKEPDALEKWAEEGEAGYAEELTEDLGPYETDYDDTDEADDLGYADTADAVFTDADDEAYADADDLADMDDAYLDADDDEAYADTDGTYTGPGKGAYKKTAESDGISGYEATGAAGDLAYDGAAPSAQAEEWPPEPASVYATEQHEADLEIRTALANEIHDGVIHALILVASRAEDAKHLITQDPVRAGDVLDSIIAACHGAAAEVRRIVSVLRAEEIEEAVGHLPTPVWEDLSRLAAEAGATFTVNGESPDDLDDMLSLTVFRIVQEALTNVLQHAGPHADAIAYVDWGDSDVEVSVTNQPTSLAPEPTVGGKGLDTMAERVQALNGLLETGPSEDGGFRVWACLPYDIENGLYQADEGQADVEPSEEWAPEPAM
jgi:signal transduction histidine kinase